MALAALLPVLMEALAAAGITAEAAAATTAARAAATGAAAAAENVAAQTAAQTAAKAAGGSAAQAAGSTAAQAAGNSGQPGMGQMFGKIWESLVGKSAEKTAAETAKTAAYDAANLGVPTQNPTREYKSASDKAAETAADKIKDKVIGSAVGMGSSLFANTAGSVIGNFVTNQHNTTQNQPGAQQGFITKSFEKLGAGPAGQRVAGLAQGGVSKALDAATSMVPGGKMTTGAASMLINHLPGVAQVKKLAGMFAEVVETGIKLPGMMEDWGKELLAGQQHLAAFNGKIGVAFAEAERREILRNVGSGAATGDSTKMLSGALSDLQDELQPIRDLATNGFNVLATAAIKVVTLGVQTVRLLSPGLEVLLWIQKNWPGGKGKNKESDLPQFIQFMNRLENRPSARAPKR